jgi:hypothetical protein
MLTELTAAIRRTVVPHGPALEGRARLTGAWRVTSVDTEFQSSGKREPAFGPDPKGFFVFTADGRAIALIAAKERQPGNSLEQLAALCRTMLAYAGPFRVERDKLIIDVDISSNQACGPTVSRSGPATTGRRAETLCGTHPRSAFRERPVAAKDMPRN